MIQLVLKPPRKRLSHAFLIAPVERAELVSFNLVSIEAQVTSILDKKAAPAESDTGTFENQIDHLVYGLYGLTEEEIRIVEGG